MILVLTNKLDVSADFVVREMQRRGQRYIRINTEDLAERACSCSLPQFTLQIDDASKGRVDISELKVVWYRRPGKPFEEVPAEQRPAPAIQRFVAEQWATWLEALELAPNCQWVNSPEAGSRFENKIRQLRLAEEVGLSIPRTLVSNDPVAIRAFAAQGGSVVAKALFSPLLEGEQEDQFIFAEKLAERDLSDDAGLTSCPTIFQEAIAPKTDYRVTVVGWRLFAVRVLCPVGGSIDWRVHKESVTFEAVPLPQEVEAKCVEYVQRAGLVFGAIDLLERDGKWFFLEINPSGEWGWLQQPVGLPIAEALCDTFAELGG